jgi:hypothetical protein
MNELTEWEQQNDRMHTSIVERKQREIQESILRGVQVEGKEVSVANEIRHLLMQPKWMI